MFFLSLQRCFGATFFLPSCLIPNYYRYQRTLAQKPLSHKELCPICLDSLVNCGGQATRPAACEKTEALLDRKYMETPCGHRFLEGCLASWFEQKLLCPCCRNKIPPIL